jgi:ribosomal protein S18 acetylase RimI-like enzyme
MYNGQRIVILNKSHLSAISLLDQQCIPTMPEGIYHHQNQAMIEACLEGRMSLGLFDRERLVGYRLTFVPLWGEENLGRKLSLQEYELQQVAQFYGILIHPDYRGKGWAKALLQASLQLIFSQKLNIVLVTVHPENIPSLNLFRGMGFVIQKRATFYGGLDRYILALTRQEWEVITKRIIEENENSQNTENQILTPPSFYPTKKKK